MENKKHAWPDTVRLEMNEKSNFYQEPRIYQYGYYDGFQKGIEYSKAREMLDLLIEVSKHHQGGHSEIGNKIKSLIKEATQTL